MKRNSFYQLLQWKNSKNRKPLVVFGARQIGKTYSVLEFGNQEYENVVYCNFEFDAELKSIFQKDLNPQRIIKSLEIIKSCTILKEKTLVFFDEIQAWRKLCLH